MGCARTSLARTSWTTEEHQAGCSKRPSSKAAASEEARRTLRYVEPLSAARTPLEDFFSILLEHEEEVKIIDVRAGWTGDDELLKLLQCRVGVVTHQRAPEIHQKTLRARHHMTIDSGASRVGRTIGAIRTDRHHPYLGQTDISRSGGDGDFLPPSPCPPPGTRHGSFPPSHYATGLLQRLALPNIIPRQYADPLPLFTSLSS